MTARDLSVLCSVLLPLLKFIISVVSTFFILAIILASSRRFMTDRSDGLKLLAKKQKVNALRVLVSSAVAGKGSLLRFVPLMSDLARHKLVSRVRV